jgi:hypothetical protein
MVSMAQTEQRPTNDTGSKTSLKLFVKPGAITEKSGRLIQISSWDSEAEHDISY